MKPAMNINNQPQGDVTQRAMWWALYISELLATKAELRAAIPSHAKLVILPSDDPELCEHNKRQLAGQDEPLILVHIERVDNQINVVPSLPGKTYTYGLA